VAHLARVAGHGIDMGHHVEVDDAVVERGHQRIGERVREARQVRVEAGRVDDKEVGITLDFDHCLPEEVKLELLVLLYGVRACHRQVVVRRMRQLQVVRLRPVAPVAYVLGERLLARVDVDRSDAKALVEQVDGEVKRRGRLARAAFFIADDNDMRPAAVHHHSPTYARRTRRSRHSGSVPPQPIVRA
jgi:hypothetical protein